jgi:hypothetical protein
MPRVHREELRGRAITVQGSAITPIAQMVAIRWPGGQVAWQTPRAVEVREQGRIRRIPIRDTTARIMLAMILAECGLAAVTWCALAQRAGHRTRRRGMCRGMCRGM